MRWLLGKSVGVCSLTRVMLLLAGPLHSAQNEIVCPHFTHHPHDHSRPLSPHSSLFFFLSLAVLQ